MVVKLSVNVRVQSFVVVKLSVNVRVQSLVVVKLSIDKKCNIGMTRMLVKMV